MKKIYKKKKINAFLQATRIWWVWVILVIFFTDSGLQRLIKDKHCTANILVVYWGTRLLIITINCSTYCKVASSNMSHIEPNPDIYFWGKVAFLISNTR